MVSRIRNITRHKENTQPTLNMSEKQAFNEYWRTLYDDEDKLDEVQRVESLVPEKKEIKHAVDHLPMKKAPGPDRLTGELLKYGGKVTLDMTVRMVTQLWRKQIVPKSMCQANIFLIPKDK